MLQLLGSHATLALIATAIVVLLAARRGAESIEGFAALSRLVFGGKEDRERRRRRRLLARTFRDELERIDGLNDWIGAQFAQLEAEVEVETPRAWLWRVLSPLSPATSVRRERSLSRALRRSRDRLIVLEGEPGAGKSVSMRRVAAEVLARALLPFGLQPRLPVYVNLRDLVRPPGAEVNAELIRNFVRHCLNRTGNEAIRDYLDRWLTEEMETGGLLFLFDSFDEIPQVLASTSADEVVAAYARAIRDFSGTMSTCRAVIASREYRGPRGLPATRFRVLRLSHDRQLLLVRRFGLTADAARRMEAFLGDPGAEMRPLVENPMFLALTCKRVILDGALPETPREVFSSYVETRIAQFRDEIRKLTGTDTASLRELARTVAFEMGSNDSLGLSPSRARLIEALERRAEADGAAFAADRIEQLLDALERVKIGRPGDDPEDRSFTFVHRRFQEFFAAERLLADPARVPPRELVSNGRWREAAVALLQTQDVATASLVLDAVREVLEAEAASLRNADPSRTNLRVPHVWRPATLHVLGILDAAYAGRNELIPPDVVELAMFVLGTIRERGTILDLKWILEVAGVLPGHLLAELFPRGEELDVDILRDTVMRTLGKLPELDSEIRSWVHRTVVGLVITGAIARRRWTVRSQLTRLAGSAPFFRAMRLASATRAAQAMMFVAATLIVVGGVATRGFEEVSRHTRSIAEGEPALHRCSGCLASCLSRDWMVAPRGWTSLLESEKACLHESPCWRDLLSSHARTGADDQATSEPELSLCVDLMNLQSRSADARLRSATTHASLALIALLLGLAGVVLRGATADAEHPARAWNQRLLVVLLAFEPAWSGEREGIGVPIALGICAMALWAEGATLALVVERWIEIAWWPLYPFVGVAMPFVQLARGPRPREARGARAEPRMRGRAGRRVALWLVGLVLGMVVAGFAHLDVVRALCAWSFVFTLLAMLGWLAVHAGGHLADLLSIGRVLRAHGTGTMGVERFLRGLFSMRGSSSSAAFVEAVERYQLLARGDAHWRALAALPGVALEDRERLARAADSPSPPGARTSWLGKVVYRIVVSLVLDESFGASAEIVVRALSRIAAAAGWPTFVSSVGELPGPDAAVSVAALKHPWQVATLGRRGAAALIRLADQTRTLDTLEPSVTPTLVVAPAVKAAKSPPTKPATHASVSTKGPSPMATFSFPAPILDAYKSGKLAVLFGSGLSLAADVRGAFPRWSELPERLLGHAAKQAVWSQAQIDAKRAFFEGGHLPLEGMLSELDTLKTTLRGARKYQAALNAIFRPTVSAPGDVHRALVELDLPVLATTNYDPLLEHVEGPPARAVFTWEDADKALSDIQEGRRVLFKIHGSAENEDTVVMTRTEYDRAAAHVPYQRTMSFLLQSYTFLLVGYGVNDPLDLDLIFGLNTAAFGSASRTHYALYKDPSASDRDRWRRDMNIQVVEYREHRDLTEILRSLRSAARGRE